MRRRYVVVALDVNGKPASEVGRFRTRFFARQCKERQLPPLRPIATMPPMWSYDIIEIPPQEDRL